MRVVATCLSPLSHGAFGESAGNATLCRRMTVVSLPGMPRVPCVSGNALRGTLRRLVMRDLFRRAEVDRTQLPAGQWDRIYAALANGGHLEAAEKRVDPSAIRELREALPPLSVFGAALYSWMLPGHMSVGILWPRCRETLDAGLVHDAGRGAGGVSAEDLVEEITQVRHVEREEHDPEVSGVTPMPTTLEVLCAGAVLESEILFAPHASDVERGAVLHGLQSLNRLGGKGSSGLGRISVTTIGHSQGDLDSYLAWLDDTTDLRDRLVALAEVLARKGKKPKKAKAK